jgi:dTDP-4-amino-4,6-dideoxygalactose transaminase
MVFKDDSSFIGHLGVMVTPTRSLDTKYLHSKGVDTGIHYPVLDYHQGAWRGTISGYQKAKCGESERAVEEILSLPCFPTMTETEIAHVEKSLRDIPN